jgi:uncharacterized RDD family membrane protein YckC
MSYTGPEDQVSIETPEHIRVDYELAGIGSRVLACTVDSVIQGLLITAISVVVSLISALEGDVAHIPIRAAIIILSSLLITIGYFVLFEMLWDGRSPGKRMAGLRVIRTDGTPITAGDSLIRNILRIIDLLPFPYTVGAISIFFTKRCQRIGDLAAGTIVVKERVYELQGASAALPDPSATAVARIPAPDETLAILRTSLAQLTPQELAPLDRFIERRFELDADARYRLAGQIAAPLRAHFPALTPTDLPSPEHFLEVLHSVWRQRPGPR